eukprot:jgi/Chlat1/3735/Chrsp259S03938
MAGRGGGGRPLGLASGLGDMMSALQSGIEGRSSGYLASLPRPVRRRVTALRGLQAKRDALQEEYEAEMAALQKKYDALYEPLYSRRAAIVIGAEEPSASEVEAGEAAVPDSTAASELRDGPKIQEIDTPAGEDTEGAKGIPEFWLTAMKNLDELAEHITEKDEAPLKALKDIRTSSLTGEHKGFQLDFEFVENEHFANTVLTKKYFMIDEEEPTLERAEGTEIQWKAGKNVTVKLMKKKAKKGGKVLTKTEKTDSFFNFFSPPDVPEDDQDLDEEEMEQLQEYMEEDYMMGAAIREKLVPHAASFAMFSELTRPQEDDEDEDDEEEEEMSPPKTTKKGRHAAAKAKAGAGAQGGEQPAECKQQ